MSDDRKTEATEDLGRELDVFQQFQGATLPGSPPQDAGEVITTTVSGVSTVSTSTATMANQTTAIITKANPIRPFTGSARRGETDFVPGPDFESWKESVLLHCLANNITSSADIIGVAKSNIDPKSGDAYETLFNCPAFGNKKYVFQSHEEFFSRMRTRYNMAESSSESRLASLLVDMISLERGSGERFTDFMNRVGKLQKEMLSSLDDYPCIPEAAIVMVSEATLLASLPRECLKDNKWYKAQELDDTCYPFCIRAAARLVSRGNPDYVSMRALSKLKAAKEIKASGGEVNYMSNQRLRRPDLRDQGNRNKDNRDNKEKCFHCGRVGHRKFGSDKEEVLEMQALRAFKG